MVAFRQETETPTREETRELDLPRLRELLAECQELRERAAHKTILNPSPFAGHEDSRSAALIAAQIVEMIDPDRKMPKRIIASSLVATGEVKAYDALWIVGRIVRFNHG
jgi:hypothetical protein